MGKKKKSKLKTGRQAVRPAPQPVPSAVPEVPIAATGLSKLSRWILAGACLLGLGLSVYAGHKTLQIRWQGIVNPSACSINSWINCDAAHASSYALLFGLPIAWWGALYYFWLGCLTVWTTLRESVRQVAVVFGYAASLVAVVFTLFKAHALVFELKTLCLVCLAMYVINAVIFVIFQKEIGVLPRQVGRVLREAFTLEKGATRVSGSFKPVFLFVGLAVVVLVGGLFAAKKVQAGFYSQERVDVAAEVAKHFKQDRINASVHPQAPVWGNPNAAVTVVEFSDFQCPYCRRAAFHLRSLLWEFRDHVRLYFMNFPLDNKINRFCRGPIHEYAGLAARAAVCAQERDKFWEFHDDLFRQQDKLDETSILDLCDKYGWSREEFAAALNSEETYERVRAEIDCAGDHVRSTPTLVINGREVEYWGHPEVVQRIIKEEIRRSGQ